MISTIHPENETFAARIRLHDMLPSSVAEYFLLKKLLPMPPLKLFLSAAFFGSCTALLPAASLQTLIDRSPFSPPQAAAQLDGTGAEQSVLEFRGMVVDGGGTAYSIFDATANKARWLKVGEGEAFKVKEYNPSTGQLEVEQMGKSLKLALKRVSIQAGPAVMANPPPPQPGGAPNANQGNPAVDARRLETVAAEVRRRRAMRNNVAAVPAAQAPSPQPPKTTP